MAPRKKTGTAPGQLAISSFMTANTTALPGPAPATPAPATGSKRSLDPLAPDDDDDSVPPPPKKARKAKSASVQLSPVSFASASEDQRPVTRGAPPVWAVSRAAMAETLPYHRKFQGGIHSSGGRIHSIYFGSTELHRSYLDENTIITRGTGNFAKVDGQMKQIKDAASEEAAFFRSARFNIDRKIPVVCILGADAMSAPARPPRPYNVMDWFYITDLWCEQNGNFVLYRFKLERADQSKPAWWMPAGTPARPSSALTVCQKTTCQECGMESKQILPAGWVCLTRECSEFWSLNGCAPTEAQVAGFNPSFLNERNEFPDLAPPFDLAPPRLTLTSGDVQAGMGFSRDAWKGFFCPDCHCCSPRRFWKLWKCDNCGLEHDVGQSPLSARHVRKAQSEIITGHAQDLNLWEASLVKYSYSRMGWFMFRKYDLGHGNRVWHVQSNSKVNEAAGGPNDMFLQAQTANLLLERSTMSNKQEEAEHLVNHFSSNWGMSYRYVVAKTSHAFADAPPVILEGLARCTWAAQCCVGTDLEPFNENLAVGYFESGAMGFHDDGEPGLAPTICAQSLGGRSTLTMRMKGEPYKGYHTSGAPYDPRLRVPDGAFLKQEREALNAKWRNTSWTKSDVAEYAVEMQKMHADAKAIWLDTAPKDRIPQRWPTKASEAPPSVTIFLDHGDFFCMSGDDLQRFYEHRVDSTDMARIVMTCRRIMPPKVKKEQKANAEFDHSILNYRGELDGNPDSSDWKPLVVDDAWAVAGPTPAAVTRSSSELSELSEAEMAMPSSFARTSDPIDDPTQVKTPEESPNVASEAV